VSKSRSKYIKTEEAFVEQESTCANTANNGGYDLLLYDKKIASAVEGLEPFFDKTLRQRTLKENALIIAEYINTAIREINISTGYRKSNIDTLADLSKFHSNMKNFREMTGEDILLYLDSFRKPEASDPLHKWIGTYTLKRGLIVKFFKWLYYSDIESAKRPRPKVVENIPRLKRKEQSIYRPTDLWSQEDDLLFLKYCPNKRDRCYHTISRDSSCRPHEILNLRIKDIAFKTTGNYQYAEVLVNGKTGSRPIPLISSIPYVKDWLDSHPQRGNPNAFLIPSLSDRTFGRKMKFSGINMAYRRYKFEYFTELAEKDPNVPPEDKQKIKELLKKPWNPYIRRHSALTEKSAILKEHVLRQHAGWSGRSQMHLKYLHYFGNESSESLLEAYGIMPKGQQIDQLRPKQCPNCAEPNKPDTKFCAKCRMVLTYDAYETTLEVQKEKEDRLSIIENQMKTLISALGNIKDQDQVNQMAQTLYGLGILKDTTKIE
jgi:integrase/recombinase XerD